MKSIERRFLALQQKQTEHSSFINFGRAVEGGRFKQEAVRRWFKKLVDRDDYDPADKRALLRYLNSRTNPPTTTTFGGKLLLKRKTITSRDSEHTKN